MLRARRLIRMRRVQDRQEVEIYHDRVRQTVENTLAPETRRRRHLHLAVELETSQRATSESLAIHFHEGGDRAKAFRYSAAAAGAASNALAFESAVRWYRMALSQHDDPEVRVRLADALSSSGRGKEAADIYLACMESANPVVQLDLHRRAATELLISGHTPEGLQALGDVLSKIGMKPPPSGRRAIPSLLLNRARILLRGLRLHHTPAGGLKAGDTDRVDACWSITRGLSMVDTIRAAEFHARHLLLALGLGDPYRAARALSVEAGYHALSGEKSHGRMHQALTMASGLAETCGNPHAVALVNLVDGMGAFLSGKWARARTTLEGAEALLRERCSGVAWELATARLMGCASMYFLGEIRELSQRLPVLLQNAHARGDLYESTLEIRVAHILRLACDEPDGANADLSAAVGRWPQSGFYMQHWWAMIAGVEIAMYRGDAAGAWSLVQSQWGALQRSLLMRAQYIRIESLFHRARAALALAAVSLKRKKGLLRAALADAAAIESQNASWAAPVGASIRAGAADLAGQPDQALHHFESAEAGFRGVDMHLFAAAARRRRGFLIGGEEGRALVSEADAWIHAQDIRNPERMTAMLAPGKAGGAWLM